ncbi:MAG TPA: histidine phosphatase family protein [Bryobacteraceae bacterium]|jgi:broad specificity phosphatase PhoE|nr:histidine phosphatase family protein [Bryobacteraceae bacterium]
MGVVHLIRHGAPEVTGVLLGRTDVPLGPAAVPAATFAVATVFGSPLRRARRTAELLFPKQPVNILDGLAERGLGDWEGRSWSEVQQGWPDLAAQADRDWFAAVPPNGEPWNLFVERVASAWREIRRARAPVAVVAHAGVNAVLCELIAGRSPLEFQQMYLEALTLEFEY